MAKAQKLLAEAKELEKLADVKEDEAEEAQEKARAADFIRVKAEITLADIVKRSLFWSKGPLRNDLSASVKDLLLNGDDSDDDSDDEAVVILCKTPSAESESDGSTPSPSFPSRMAPPPSPPPRFLLQKKMSPPRVSHLAKNTAIRRTSKVLKRSSRELAKMSSRNLMAESRRGLLTRESSKRVMASRLINPASKRRLLSVTSRNNSFKRKDSDNTESKTLHRFIPQNAPLSMFPEDMSLLDQYTFRDGSMGEGYYHSTFVDPPKSTSPTPPDDNDDGDDEKKKNEEPPKRRWDRAISLIGTIKKLNIRKPKNETITENGKIVKTELKKKMLKSAFPAEDVALIEDCLRTALGDSRQATRILNV